MPGKGPNDFSVLRKLFLGQRRHHASRIRQSHIQFYLVTDREPSSDPFVLDEASFVGTNDNVHPEPALIEAALGLKLVQALEGGCRQDGDREQVEE